MQTDRDRLIELVDKAKEEYANDITDHTETDYIVETLLNEGVIVPPCKVGDKVYCIENNLKIIEEYTVSGYTIKNGKLALFVFRGIYSAVVSEWFLTKEESEEKLKEINKNER